MYFTGLTSLGTASSKLLWSIFDKGQELLDDEFDIITRIRRGRSEHKDKDPIDIDSDHSDS
jgi:hypothetical protein